MSKRVLIAANGKVSEALARHINKSQRTIAHTAVVAEQAQGFISPADAVTEGFGGHFDEARFLATPAQGSFSREPNRGNNSRRGLAWHRRRIGGDPI